MVSVPNRNAEAFFSKPPADVFVFLFHGVDAGLIHERARAAIRSNTPDLSDPFAVVRLTGEAVSSDPARLLDEAATVGLWAPSRSIWVDATSSTALSGLEILLETPAKDVRVVIEAGELRRDAPLRRLCEQSRFAAAVECPLDSLQDVTRLIDDYLRRDNLEIEAEARDALTTLLTSDRLSSRAELEKLTTYANDAGAPITLRDVDDVVVGGSAIGPDRVLKAALAGDFAELADSWSRAQAIGLDGAALAGFALRRLLLQHAGVYRDSSALRQPALRQAIRTLAGAIQAGRREPRLSDALALRAFWSTARLASRSAGDS